MSVTPWVKIYKKPGPCRFRLWCFPHAGAGASVYYPWPDQLPAGVEVCALQPPGRENRIREPLFTDLLHLTEAATAAVVPLLDVPFAFFGHSVGSLVAFEMTRRLRDLQAPLPGRLFVSAIRAPHLVSPREPLYQLSDAEFMDKLRSLGGTAEVLLQHEEMRKLILPILRADFQMRETYHCVPGPRLTCPISAFGGLDDSAAGRDELAAWAEHSTGDFELRMFPGGHFYLRTAQAQVLPMLRSAVAALMG
jgi:medium-chain acyl-[acyl-carrier-protein] hydrolase